ncbi:MAG: hypothetical protein UD936_01965 [Acutalibacteraceae bacterium]|nr:hypothetical protein [Acutalibacteraceae bacterium]
MAVLIVATMIFALIWSSTQDEVHCYTTVGAGVTTLLAPCIMYAPELGKAMDRFGLRLVPEDEEGQV